MSSMYNAGISAVNLELLVKADLQEYAIAAIVIRESSQ